MIEFAEHDELVRVLFHAGGECCERPHRFVVARDARVLQEVRDGCGEALLFRMDGHP